VGLFLISGIAFLIGVILIVLLKNATPPPPQDQLHFESSADIPKFLIDQDAFEDKCVEFLSKFNLEHKHSVWANNSELEIAMIDETPVVGGTYLALCIIDPPNKIIDAIKVKGFIDTVKGEGASRGIFITTGYFDEKAISLIEEEPIELVNVVSFISYLKKFDIYE
jgi:restriction system protein